MYINGRVLPMSSYAEVEASQSITAKGIGPTLQNDTGRTVGVHHSLDHRLEQCRIT